MRNIALKNFDRQRLSNISDCEGFCLNDKTLYAHDSGIITRYDENREKIICNLEDTLYPSNNGIPKTVDFIYHYEKDLLYLILSNGDIIYIETEKNGTEEICGSVEYGIRAAQWSPEQEVLALVNGCNNVVVLTSDFDLVTQTDLHSGDFGEKQVISVGWGKKETQFQGSAGKYVAKKEPEEIQIAEDDTINISWRGDADYFAVSSINPETRLRYIRVFSKGGILQCTSETLNGLENCLDWRPSGNLIASTQKLPNKYNICFFEKNGLKHGEFSLPFDHSTSRVTQVLWSNDSKVLAVFVTDKSAGQTNHDCYTVNEKYVLFYTVNNYKWYCKYKLTFKAKDHPLLIKWDHQYPSVFHVISKQNDCVFHHMYTWNWVTIKSKTFNAQDESFVAVIDGCNVFLTSFNRGIVPPPMCTYTITAKSNVNSVSFAFDSSPKMLLHLSSGDVLFYKLPAVENINHELLGTMKSINSESEDYYNYQWIESKKLLANMIKHDEKLSHHFVSIINLNEKNGEILFENINFPLYSCVAMVKVSKLGTIIYDNSGKFYMLKDSDISKLEISENKNILDMDIMEKNGEIQIFSLDSSNKFYMNSKMLFNNVLSFHIHDNFLLLTNMKHELLCLNSDDDLSQVESLSEVFKRRIERGSRLVTSIQKDMKVILQMPRGNLECIQPRALSIYTVGKYLDSLCFDMAFDLMRKQRINLNLLYDHNPESFSNNLALFIEQIKDPQWLNLFISEISEEDVTMTMYSVAYKGRNNLNTFENGRKSKVNTICDLLEKALSSTPNSEKLLLPLITCHIKRNKIESQEKALMILKNLKEREIKNQNSSISFNEAFRYMLYLIDVEEIYKIALGMYDFDLVLLIAEKSQKDPKEYLPFLNELRKLELHYQRFTIDKYLKRYEKALTNLVLCNGDDRFNECLNFIKTHRLYKAALKVIPQDTDRYKRVCLCYGEDLMRSNMFEEAGIMFCNAGMYRNALDAYRRSANWHEILNCVNELDLNVSEMNKLYLDIASDLVEAKEYSMAATIYLDYLRDVDESVKILANGKLFAEAYRVCRLHNSPDLVHMVIVPTIIQQAKLTALQIAEFQKTFTEQKNRLQVVRRKKLEEADNRKETEMDSDVYSEASSVITQSHASSRGTNRTYRSAKNKRKQERKLLSLKEGSPYEHLALVVSLYNLVTNSIALIPEVKEMNKFLVKINQYEMAEKLQKNFEELLKIIENSKAEIWTSELLGNGQSFGPEATSNDIASFYTKSENAPQTLLEPKYTIPPEIPKNLKWKLEIIKT